MSAIDEIIEAIDGVISQITEATTATSAIVQQTEQTLEQVQAVGLTASAEGLTALKDELEGIVGQFSAVNEAMEGAQTTAKSVAENT